MTAAPAVNLGFCNPYGAETGGPKRVLGGLYGPGSAATPGVAGLPPHIVQGEWTCANRAEVRCRCRCRCDHQGPVMALCSWHDEVVYQGEITAGTTRRVSKNVRSRGHFEEISRRQLGSCPRCLYPVADGVDYAALERDWRSWSYELAMINAVGGWYSPRAASVRSTISAIGDQFDEARRRGIIHNCPMVLEAVS